MSEQVQVVPADVRAAAAQMGAAADAVAAVQHHAHAGRVGSAMAGSRSAGAADGLSGAWRQRAAQWSEDATAQAARLDAATDASLATDEAAAARLGRFTSRLGAQAVR